MPRYVCKNCGKSFSASSKAPRCPYCYSFRVSCVDGGNSLFDLIKGIFGG